VAIDDMRKSRTQLTISALHRVAERPQSRQSAATEKSRLPAEERRIHHDTGYAALNAKAGAVIAVCHRRCIMDQVVTK
jgi:hypothetical protein